MKKPELLAPAGSYEKAIIAFKYGADAVYVGTPNVSLRTRVKVDEEDLKNIIEYAKKHDKKVYAAINIYAFDDKYEEIEKQCKMLEKLKVDGIIASDGGVIDTIKEFAPSIPINISTQANTISLHSCKFWQKNGAKRIILGREINIEDLRKIMKEKDEDLEIEIFIHGAICFAYSGRCYLSDYLASRGANQGDCAQCCRWNYNMYVEDRNHPGELMPVEEDQNGTTIFSSKDLCIIDELKEIMEMGVDSLKIEGRLKTENYLAGVINTYRCAIDDILENKPFDPQIYLDELNKIKTRELTKFNFRVKNNSDIHDIQDLGGRQYNQFFLYTALVDEMMEENRAVVYVKNKMKLNDTLELLLPGKLKAIKFEITDLIDVETGERLQEVNPGKQDQKVIINVPCKVEKYHVIRKKL